jgi:cell division protein FtsQ
MLSDLGSDARGSWSATLQSGVVLRLGTGDILKKMRGFSRMYRAELSAQMDRIAYIDLRYSNGLAVGWKAAGAQAAAHESNGNTNFGVSGHG